MARSLPICPQIDTAALTRIPGVSLDMLFLVVIQALAVIFLAKFLHLFLRRYNQPSAVSQSLVRIDPPPCSIELMKTELICSSEEQLIN